jgi:autotransporter translocation and assembly factor TamB
MAFLPKSVAVACAGVKTAPRTLLASEADNKGPAQAQDAQEEEEAHCHAASRDFTTLSRRIGFRTVELVRLPIHAAVKDLFPKGEAGWDTDARFYQQKDSGDGHWAGTVNGTWQVCALCVGSMGQAAVSGSGLQQLTCQAPTTLPDPPPLPAATTHDQHTNAALCAWRRPVER